MSTVSHVLTLPDPADLLAGDDSLPPCPNCREDSLAMIGSDKAVCSVCSCSIIRKTIGLHILDVPVSCHDCPWTGRVETCEKRTDGDLACPDCGNVIVVRLGE